MTRQARNLLVTGATIAGAVYVIRRLMQDRSAAGVQGLEGIYPGSIGPNAQVWPGMHAGEAPRYC